MSGEKAASGVKLELLGQPLGDFETNPSGLWKGRKSEPSSHRCRPDADHPYRNRHEGDQGDQPGAMPPESDRHCEQDGPSRPKHDRTPEGRQDSCEQVRNCDQCVADEGDRRARMYPPSGAGDAHFDVPIVGGPLGDCGPGGNTGDVAASASARGYVNSTRKGLENGAPFAGSCRLWASSAYLSYQ